MVQLEGKAFVPVPKNGKSKNGKSICGTLISRSDKVDFRDALT